MELSSSSLSAIQSLRLYNYKIFHTTVLQITATELLNQQRTFTQTYKIINPYICLYIRVEVFRGAAGGKVSSQR